MSKKEHVFAVCAYKESPFLETCLRSLKAQTANSDMIVATSTPCKYIEDLAKKYACAYYINEGESGITQDWNFAYSCVRDQYKYVTIAHQDDVYEKAFAQKTLTALNGRKRPLMAFTDYFEVRNGKKTMQNQLLKIKRLMLLPMKVVPFQKSIWIRRRILSMGSPICCPSVTFAVDNVPEVIFQNGFRACEDWEAWEMLSKKKGDFVYIPQPLMGHRIHEGSETSAIIGDNLRTQEEFKMFCKFWPKPIAKLIGRVYAKGQNSNDV